MIYRLTLYFRDLLLRFFLHHLLLELDLCYLGHFLSLCGNKQTNKHTKKTHTHNCSEQLYIYLA